MFAAPHPHRGRHVESDFLVKTKRWVGRKSEALISAVGTFCSYIETHRRRHYALLGLSETQNNRPRPTEFPGRKQRRHYSVPTSLYCEIGLLKNYAESRGSIPRNRSVETLLSGQVLRQFVSPSPFDRHVAFKTPQRVLCDIATRRK